ncbi:MAG TPA: peptidoglycan DD-metalloendopeptidase family protein [Alphaproteobacteria bacterium]|nr:peptidoglycan DD-metalloendopeptidase family protein [Alphaproteobacteria bacterium]
MRRPDLAVLLALLVAAPLPSAWAADPPERRLEQIERSLGHERDRLQRLARESEYQTRELETLRARAVAVAASLRDSEDTLTGLERRLVELAGDAERKEQSFAQRRIELVRLVAELGRVSRQPPEAALVLPSSPLDAVRTAKLLAALTPALRDQAMALAAEVDALQRARAAADVQRREVAEAAERLAGDRETLDALIARRAKMLAEAESAERSSAARLERLAREAGDLRELVERLDAERAVAEARERSEREAARPREPQVAARMPPPAERLRPFGGPGGTIAPPVHGRVVLSFGQPGEGGQPHRGMTVEARPGARLVAPLDGKIVFAGPFRTYGLILIIEHSEGYHTLLAGLGRIDATVGQTVTTGEPVGTAGSAESGYPSIYVELRRNGQPIDPLPWLAPRNEKVSG